MIRIKYQSRPQVFHQLKQDKLFFTTFRTCKLCNPLDPTTMSYTDRLDKIIQRTERLSQVSISRAEALRLAREDNQKLKLEIDNQAHIIEDLNNKIKIIKLAHSFEEGEDISALKRKINEYIREIDSSIALLND